MSVCVDCGAKRGGPLCRACVETASALGHTGEERLAMLGHSMTGFRMESWSSSAAAWSAMDEGTAPKVWAPRKTREEAVHKCIEWTGSILIPAMRVIDLDTGAVVWQDTSQYPDAGDLIIPEWTVVLYEQVRAAAHREYLASLCECGMPEFSDACRANHEGGVPPSWVARRTAKPTPHPVDDGALFSLEELSA